jgi:ferredoxin/flavodoxin---NADP+ reductase
MTAPASDSGPLHIAVVGAGPAGVYAVDALVQGHPGVQVDVFDLLPTPYGLVRYGVAPDHVKMKSVIRTLLGILESPRVRFFGNVRYAVDTDLTELRRHYAAVVFATGSPEDRRLGIPGEELPGSVAAADLVAWYSGHPEARRAPALDVESVAVIGAGNVALDVARVLAKGAAGLRHTDVPEPVLEWLAASTITDIHLVARRGPAQAKFTQVELREMGELDNADAVVQPADVQLDAAATEAMEQRRATRNMMGYFQDWSTRVRTGKPRRVHFHFYRRPVRFLGADAVTGLELEVCLPDGAGGVIGTGELTALPAQLVVRSVGYRAEPLPGMPFDGATATVPNDAGRVLGETGAPVPGVYVAGWIKRGPTGVIGTNKADARETVDSVWSDAAARGLPQPAGTPDQLLEALRSRGVRPVEWEGWLRLDTHEQSLGRDRGADRVKTADLDEMLAIGQGVDLAR